MARKRKSPTKVQKVSTEVQLEVGNFYEKERLDDLLMILKRCLESAMVSKGGLPEKIWIKQHFAVGVNDVTRVLERMPCNGKVVQSDKFSESVPGRTPLVSLQVVILASDCDPKWLTKHIPSLASSRNVPVISIRDKRRGSLRLGELLKLRTAMAIGIKVRGGVINKAMDEVLINGTSPPSSNQEARDAVVLGESPTCKKKKKAASIGRILNKKREPSISIIIEYIRFENEPR